MKITGVLCMSLLFLGMAAFANSQGEFENLSPVPNLGKITPQKDRFQIF